MLHLLGIFQSIREELLTPALEVVVETLCLPEVLVADLGLVWMSYTDSTVKK